MPVLVVWLVNKVFSEGMTVNPGLGLQSLTFPPRCPWTLHTHTVCWDNSTHHVLTGLRFYFAVNQESQERKAWENSRAISSLSSSSLQNHLLIPELENYSKQVGLRWLWRWLEELSEEVFSSESFGLLSVPWCGWQRLWVIPHTLKRKTHHAAYLLTLSCGYGQFLNETWLSSQHAGTLSPFVKHSSGPALTNAPAGPVLPYAFQLCLRPAEMVQTRFTQAL